VKINYLLRKKHLRFYTDNFIKSDKLKRENQTLAYETRDLVDQNQRLAYETRDLVDQNQRLEDKNRRFR